MILKSKIGYSYYIIFFVVIPAIVVAYYLIYLQVIPLQIGMIIFVFGLPFLVLPFVFEYYTIDENYLCVKNILGITTKKVGFTDYEDIYALDKKYGKRGGLTSSSIYIVDKKERIIQLRSYYCDNLEDFIEVLSKGKTLREDRAQLHLIKIDIRHFGFYTFFLGGLNLWFMYLLVTQHIAFQWWVLLFCVLMSVLVFMCAKYLYSSVSDARKVKKDIDAKTLRFSQIDKRLKVRKSFF